MKAGDLKDINDILEDLEDYSRELRPLQSIHSKIKGGVEYLEILVDQPDLPKEKVAEIEKIASKSIEIGHRELRALHTKVRDRRAGGNKEELEKIIFPLQDKLKDYIPSGNMLRESKMRITRAHLRRLIRESLQGNLLEADEEDIDFDPDDLAGMQIPVGLKKMLDPDVSPAKYAALDSQLDDTGKPEHQAFALVAFALSYADGDFGGVKALLRKALQLVPKIEKARAKGEKKKAEKEKSSGSESDLFN